MIMVCTCVCVRERFLLWINSEKLGILSEAMNCFKSYECLLLFFRVDTEFNDVASSAKTFINCFPLQVNET